LDSAYGDSRVLFGLSLAVSRGEVVALLGRNGAGKTTTLASIIGLVKPRAGSIRFDGAEICGCEPFEACRTGLGFVAENCRLFGGLTVAENLETARRPARSGPSRWDTAEVLDFFPRREAFSSPSGFGAFWRRTAHGCHRSHADRESDAAAAGRALRGSRAARRASAA
jgi:branched-chain amino acid transport system ATP-binding protein